MKLESECGHSNTSKYQSGLRLEGQSNTPLVTWNMGGLMMSYMRTYSDWERVEFVWTSERKFSLSFTLQLTSFYVKLPSSPAPTKKCTQRMWAALMRRIHCGDKFFSCSRVFHVSSSFFVTSGFTDANVVAVSCLPLLSIFFIFNSSVSKKKLDWLTRNHCLHFRKSSLI